VVSQLHNPDAIKPGNKMIAFENLSQQDLEALAVYLLNQK
jgi:cytochrome c1